MNREKMHTSWMQKERRLTSGHGRAFGFLILCGVNALIGSWIYLVSGNSHSLASALLFISFILLSAVFSFVVVSKRTRPVTFMLMLYWCYAMAMPALYQVRINTFPWYPTAVDASLVLPASIICLASVVMFLIGYVSSPSLLRSVNRSGDIYVRPVFHKHASVFILVVAAAYSAYAVSVIGLLPFISTRAAASVAMADGGVDSTGIGLLRTLPGSMSVAIFLILAYQRYFCRDISRSTRIIFWLSALLLLVMNFPASLARFMMISITMIIVLTVFRDFMKSYKAVIYVTAPVMMYFVFPFLGQINRHSDLAWDFSIFSPSESMLHGDFDGFQSIMNVYSLVESAGVAFGGRLISTVLFFVPRGLWEGKYSSTGSDAAEVVGYDYLNISMPLPGEIFSDFGWIGLIIVMYYFGRLVSNLDLRVEGRSEGRYGIEVAMIGIIIAAYMPILFRGALLSVIAPTAVAIFMIVLWGGIRRMQFSPK